MTIEAAESLAKHRLFRPLAFRSPHYERHESDELLVREIVKWTSHILLGGKYYNLKVLPEDVFQIPSNLLNRMVYLIPVWDPKLVRTIVLDSRRKTGKAKAGCGLGDLEKLSYAGG